MPVVCDICGGSGRTRLCPGCGGSGLLGLPDCYQVRCDDCDGKGFVPEHPCLACAVPETRGKPPGK